MLLAFLHLLARAHAVVRRLAPSDRFTAHQWANASDPDEGVL